MPMFTRRHYVAMSKLVSDMRLTAIDRGDMYLLQTCDLFIARMTETLRRDNPRFNVQRFRVACGYVPEIGCN